MTHASFETIREALPQDRWTTYERAALYELARQGFDVSSPRETAGRVDAQVVGRQYEVAADRWRAWCAESIHYAIGAARKNDNVMVLRCLLQASNYVGRLGGFWPAGLGDAYVALKNHLEDALQ